MILGTNFWFVVVVNSSWSSSHSHSSSSSGFSNGSSSYFPFMQRPCACFVHVIDNNNWQSGAMSMLRCSCSSSSSCWPVIILQHTGETKQKKQELPCAVRLLAAVCWPPAALKLNIFSIHNSVAVLSVLFVVVAVSSAKYVAPCWLRHATQQLPAIHSIALFINRMLLTLQHLPQNIQRSLPRLQNAIITKVNYE